MLKLKLKKETESFKPTQVIIFFNGKQKRCQTKTLLNLYAINNVVT